LHHFWEFEFFFAMLSLLERIGFIVFNQQAANQPLIKTKRPNVSQNVDAHIITIPLALSNSRSYRAT
jgi:hypothetical protein